MSNYTLQFAITTTVTAPTIVELSPDGRFACIGGNSRKLHVVDRTKSNPPAFYTLPSNPTVVHWDQKFILVGSEDGSLTIFFYHRGFDEFIHGAFPLRDKRVYAAIANGSPIFSVSFDPKGRKLAFSTADIISIFDFKPDERWCCPSRMSQSLSNNYVPLGYISFRCTIPFVNGPNRADPALMSLAFTSSGSLLVSHSIHGVMWVYFCVTQGVRC